MRLFCTIALLALVACSTDSGPNAPSPVEPPATAQARVSGRVLDYVSGTGRAGVRIDWSPQSPLQGRTTTTSGADGAYEVTLPPAGFYIVTLDLGTTGLLRVPGKRYQTNLLVNDGGCGVRYGAVIDAVTRMPISGVRIANAGRSAETGADGTYLLNLGCPGPTLSNTGTLSASHPSYAFVWTTDGRGQLIGIRRWDVEMQAP